MHTYQQIKYKPLVSLMLEKLEGWFLPGAGKFDFSLYMK